MGCWGITAFESDEGLGTLSFIRAMLPKDGHLELEKVIAALQQDEWYAPPDVKLGSAHTSPMMLAEIMCKYLDQDMNGLDNTVEWAPSENKFGDITSFTATKDSILWLHDYILSTLIYKQKDAEYREKHAVQDTDRNGGWFQKKDWIDWQKHMKNLVNRLDVLSYQGNQIELISPEVRQRMNASKCYTDMPACARLFYELEIELQAEPGQFGDWLAISYMLNDDFAVSPLESAEKICSAFRHVDQHYGADIARTLYNEKSVIVAHEIEEAGQYLSLGGKPELMADLARVGAFAFMSDILEKLEVNEQKEVIRRMNSVDRPEKALEILAAQEQTQGGLESPSM